MCILLYNTMRKNFHVGSLVKFGGSTQVSARSLKVHDGAHEVFLHHINWITQLLGIAIKNVVVKTIFKVMLGSSITLKCPREVS